MRTKTGPLFFFCALFAAVRPAAAETIVWLPLDGDALSVVNADRNAAVFGECWDQSPHSIEYVTNVPGRVVCDRNLNFLRGNAGSLKLEKTRLAINLDAFPLSNDVDSVTIEFFTKGSGLTAWFPFFCLGPYTKPVAAASDPLTPYLKLTPNPDGNVLAYLRSSTGHNEEIFATAKLFDDAWHHVAITVAPADGHSEAAFYMDGALVERKALTKQVKWTGGAGSADGSPLYLYLGTRRSTVYLDEIRISAGVLPEGRWMRQFPSPVPADGETLLYLPFDTDGQTIVHAEEDAASYRSADLVFRDIGGRKSVRDGEGTLVREPNLGGLFCDRQRYYYRPDHWAFRSNLCQSATIEFFYRGESVVDNSPVFRLGNDANSLRIALQSYSDADRGFSARAFLSVRDRTNKNTDGHYTSVVCDADGVMSDGKWHHFAMTTETVENGTKGRVRFYLDYALVRDAVLAEPWCAPDRNLEGDTFNLGSHNCVCTIDELRISKGALPPVKFLRRCAMREALRVFIH